MSDVFVSYLMSFKYPQVYDQYVNFISLEEDMFTLKHQGSEALSYYGV